MVNDTLRFDGTLEELLSLNKRNVYLYLDQEHTHKIYRLSEASGLEIGQIIGLLVEEALKSIDVDKTVALAREKKEMAKESKALKEVKGEKKMATVKPGVSFCEWARETKGHRGLQGKVLSCVKDDSFPKRLKSKSSILAYLLGILDVPKATVTKIMENLWTEYEGSNKRVKKVKVEQVAGTVAKKRGRPPKKVEVLEDDVLLPIDFGEDDIHEVAKALSVETKE
jgi:hypothetical protein